jgi:hypothetical protein
MSSYNPYGGDGFADGLARGFGMVQDYWRSKAAQDEAKVNIEAKRQEMDQKKQLFPGELKKQEADLSYLGAQTESAKASAAHLGAETETENATRQSKIEKAAADAKESAARGNLYNSESGINALRIRQARKEMQDADDIKRLLYARSVLDAHRDDLANPDIIDSIHALDAMSKGVAVPRETLMKAVPVYANTFLKRDLNIHNGTPLDHTVWDTAGNMVPKGAVRQGSRLAGVHVDNKGRFVVELETTVKDTAYGKLHTFIEPWADENGHVIHLDKKDIAKHVEGVAGLTHAIDYVSNNASRFGAPVEKVDAPTALKLIDGQLEALSAGYYKGGGYNELTGEKNGPEGQNKTEQKFVDALVAARKAGTDAAKANSFGDPKAAELETQKEMQRIIDVYTGIIPPERIQQLLQQTQQQGIAQPISGLQGQPAPNSSGWSIKSVRPGTPSGASNSGLGARGA